MKILSGWKEISAYMNRGLRTVQRWERLGLPIHRVGTGKRAPVFAFAEEVDAWGKDAPSLRREIDDLRNQIAALHAELRSLKRKTSSTFLPLEAHREGLTH